MAEDLLNKIRRRRRRGMRCRPSRGGGNERHRADGSAGRRIARGERTHARRIDPDLELGVEADAHVVAESSGLLHDRSRNEHPLVGPGGRRAADDRGRRCRSAPRGRRGRPTASELPGFGECEAHGIPVARDVQRGAGAELSAGTSVAKVLPPTFTSGMAAPFAATQAIALSGARTVTRIGSLSRRAMSPFRGENARRIDDQASGEREVGQWARDADGDRGMRAVDAHAGVPGGAAKIGDELVARRGG